MAEAIGVDAARLKIIAFVYAALLACVSGWLYAHLQRFVNPTPFGISAGHRVPVHGGGRRRRQRLGRGRRRDVITMLKEVLQDVLPKLLGRSGNFEMIVFGVLIVLMLQYARDGLWPLVARVLPRRTPSPVPDAPPLPRARANRRRPVRSSKCARPASNSAAWSR